MATGMAAAGPQSLSNPFWVSLINRSRRDGFTELDCGEVQVRSDMRRGFNLVQFLNCRLGLFQGELQSRQQI